MLKADNGATMETDLVETPTGWVARYLIVQAPRACRYDLFITMWLGEK
jgi:hypothetical protein